MKVALAILALAAVAHAEPYTVADMRVELPSGWVELPDMSQAAEKSLVTGAFTGGAKVHGQDPAFSIVAWLSGKKKKGGTVRAELETLHASMKNSLQDGAKLLRYDVTETANRITVGFEVERDKLRLIGTIVGAMQKGGVLRGWMAACGFAASMDSHARPQCEQVIGTFQVTLPDAELVPLEPKKK